MKNKLSKVLKTLLIAMCIPLAIGASGCSSKKEEEKNWTLTAKDGEGYSVVSRTTGISFNDGVATVKDGTSFTFTIDLKAGYKADPEPIVKANDVALTKNNDSTYLTVIKENTTINVSNISKEEIKYNVAFTYDTGFEFTNVSINLDESGKATVLEDSEVSFKVKILEGYEAENLLVKANGKIIVPRDDVYSKVIEEDTVFTVSGVNKETIKHNISFINGSGFTYTNLSVSLSSKGDADVPEGSDVTFKVEPNKGYTTESMVVKANGKVIFLDQEDEHYHVKVDEDVVVTVSDVKLQVLSVTMKDTSNYSFGDIEGISLEEGVGKVDYGTTVSFKVVLNEELEKGDSFAVKFNDTVLTANEDVYSFTVEENGEISVTGYVYAEAIIHEQLIDYQGSVSEDINVDAGYTKSYQYNGQWGSHKDIFETELAKYAQVRFSVKCLTGHYFEFIKSGLDLSLIATNETTWTEYRIDKEAICNEQEEVVGYKYQIYKNDTWTQFSFTQDGFLNEYKIQLGGDANAKFLISELRGTKDPSYVPGQKEITFNETTSNHTLVVEGQSAAPYKAIVGDEFNFTVTPSEGFTSVVRFNDEYLIPVSENSYSITVAKNNVIDIVDSIVVNALVLNGAVDKGNTTSSINCNWAGVGLSLAFNGVENLSSYSTLFFDFYLEQDGYFIFKANGAEDNGTVGVYANEWHKVTLTVNNDVSSVNISVSGVSHATDANYPEGGFNIDLVDNSLTSVAMAFHAGTSSTVNTGIFTSLFGIAGE